MRRVIKRLIPAPLRTALREQFGGHFYSRPAYSQEGEDLVLQRIFEAQPEGIYVDVGAHHPFRFSNTCLLHQRGWRGINIDAMPGSMALFNRFRPADVNLEVGIGVEPCVLDFHLFREPALNTFDGALADQRQATGWPRGKTVQVPCFPLSEILSRYLPALGANTIDLLTIDVEGVDFEVLQSNDWTRFRPRALVVELLDQDLASVVHSQMCEYCSALGYRPFAKLYHSAVFLRS